MLEYVRMIAPVVNRAVSNGAEARQKESFGPVAMKSPKPETTWQRISNFLLGGTDAPGGGVHLTCQLTRDELKSLHQAA